MTLPRLLTFVSYSFPAMTFRGHLPLLSATSANEALFGTTCVEVSSVDIGALKQNPILMSLLERKEDLKFFPAAPHLLRLNNPMLDERRFLYRSCSLQSRPAHGSQRLIIATNGRIGQRIRTGLGDNDWGL